jgi:ADP-ribose pyrophosphatase YjhB (NUDIX family)
VRIIRVRALIAHKGKILFVQHPHHPEGTWALPGGRVEEGERLDDAIKRELVEELGVKPVLAGIRYIHQLFLANGDESIEFFFAVNNGKDYADIDLLATSHGAFEIRSAAYINPAENTVLPEFLAQYEADERSGIWPILRVRVAESI